VRIAQKLVRPACTQKSGIQNCTNPGPRLKASKRLPSLLSSQGSFSAALPARVWALELRACFSLVSKAAYQNQELLVSGAVFAASRRLANESVGGGMAVVKEEGVQEAGYNFL